MKIVFSFFLPDKYVRCILCKIEIGFKLGEMENVEGKFSTPNKNLEREIAKIDIIIFERRKLCN